jgi:hypothetical protein
MHCISNITITLKEAFVCGTLSVAEKATCPCEDRTRNVICVLSPSQPTGSRVRTYWPSWIVCTLTVPSCAQQYLHYRAKVPASRLPWSDTDVSSIYSHSSKLHYHHYYIIAYTSFVFVLFYSSSKTTCCTTLYIISQFSDMFRPDLSAIFRKFLCHMQHMFQLIY